MLPLAGQRILITRASDQAGGLGDRLRALGATVLELPTIRIEPQPAQARDLSGFDWLVFTSTNAVRHFPQALAQLPPGLRLAAVGPATASALAERGAEVALVPARYDARAVAEALAQAGCMAGSRVLLPRGDLADASLPEALAALGAQVEPWVVYRTLPAEAPAGLDGKLAEVDWVVFASPSAARNLVGMLGGPAALSSKRVLSIGPRTSAEVRALGLRVSCEAAESTSEGLVRAMCEQSGPA